MCQIQSDFHRCSVNVVADKVKSLLFYGNVTAALALEDNKENDTKIKYLDSGKGNE